MNREIWTQIWRIVQLGVALGFIVLALVTMKSNLDRGLLLMIISMLIEQDVTARMRGKPRSGC